MAADDQGQKFQPHANAPGPARLKLERADNSGVVHTDPTYIADRQAIVNHVMAYSYLIDEGRWEDWFDLFADDFSFETTVPEIGTVLIKGKEAFRPFIDDRYIKPGKTAKSVRRHTQGNVHVAEQTATTAKVRTYMFISNVPNADKLSVLTSGTYNAELEKRDGRWTITRWYIECDVPLSPSPLPEGFTEEQFKWIPDPTTAMPGAGPVAKPLQGKINLKNHPFSMGDLYDNSPVWSWTDIDVVIVDHLTDAASAAALLPEELSTFPIPELPGYAAVKQVWAHYRDSSFGPYDEFITTIPCLHNGQMYLHVPFIYVDNDAALTGGREIGGWPKKMAEIHIERVGNQYLCTLDRNGERIASVSMTVGGKLFSTPLPADKAVSLPYPYNMTLPLPPPTGKPQESVLFPTTTLKVIPGVGTENSAPIVARVIGAPWHMKGDFYSGANASAAYGRSDEDPLDSLPNLQTLGAMFFHGEMTLALSDMVVLKDLLVKQDATNKQGMARQ